MARKAAAESTSAPAEPRRSTRIGTQQKAEPPKSAAPAKEKNPRVSKKRTAEEAKDAEEVKDGDTAGNVDATEEDQGDKKRAKGDSVDGDEKDELASDISEGAKKLEIGDTLPALTIKNQNGEDIEVQNLANDNGVVLFLVPKADTPGCTNQACGFRDAYPDFESVNYKVYCLSADTPTAQTKWQTKFTLPYPLLSDPNRVLISALGAADGKKTKRSHYVFEQGGKLIDRKNPVKPADSPKLALEFINSRNSAT